MSDDFVLKNVASGAGVPETGVKSVMSLLDSGATVPFIARYRKERTGNLDETAILAVKEKLDYFRELVKRKDTVAKSISEQGQMTPEIQARIDGCVDKAVLEDLYLPFKPKKRTRATVAREKGLQGLADYILKQTNTGESKADIVNRYVDSSKGVGSYDEAIAGALDIVAEVFADDDKVRGFLRGHLVSRGVISSKAKPKWRDAKSKYENYYMHSELLKKAPSHRMLAIRRGADEGVLSWEIVVDEEFAVSEIERIVIRSPGFIFLSEIKGAVADTYKRLIFPSIEKEVFSLKMEEAEKEAIVVFSKNLRNLLLAAPAGGKAILGVDPGFRTGCKVAVVDKLGNFVEYKAIFPHEPHNRTDEAERVVADFVSRYGIELIAIGNGTASRETDSFVRGVIKRHEFTCHAVVVSEAGASVYSASKIAIDEFPALDVTVRGAISIARRLQDPLAELVKIDPKSIGVGQYQHDVDQGELKKGLDSVVESCVNFVGVELNTASYSLLSFVSGIGPALAKNIVEYRAAHGAFKSRRELLKVSKFGDKAFELSAGFLRIRGAVNPLDCSAVHPESYHVVEKMARDLGVSVSELVGSQGLVSRVRAPDYVDGPVGLLTINDILSELLKPGLDPREKFEYASFSDEVSEISDLKVDMELEGVVTNVCNFGAFVDIGVHQDGLIHISKLAKKFVKDPNEVVAVGDRVKVKVASVDLELKRIGLERVFE